ncbi:hypothetical protein HNQ95_004871 [Aminobacter ciceronei]|uniref:Uncharacterized protein n=1 Tax=Aminobacter ciceronei TaxID=150723 RepID=A0ABR6CCU9_9HYPH|nr:hypothetical protein [Aminobacter ciceronei]MBA8909074.1 hypothetical protein [Aminobacter ciceronei]MBA9022846.1 hypothetical protein [Aminobacter ciceronei]
MDEDQGIGDGDRAVAQGGEVKQRCCASALDEDEQDEQNGGGEPQAKGAWRRVRCLRNGKGERTEAERRGGGASPIHRPGRGLAVAGRASGAPCGPGHDKAERNIDQ